MIEKEISQIDMTDKTQSPCDGELYITMFTPDMISSTFYCDKCDFIALCASRQQAEALHIGYLENEKPRFLGRGFST